MGKKSAKLNIVGQSEQANEPIIVCRDGEEIRISRDEASVLELGPKFCIMVDLIEDSFEVELEARIMKYRWELMKKDKENE